MQDVDAPKSSTLLTELKLYSRSSASDSLDSTLEASGTNPGFLDINRLVRLFVSIKIDLKPKILRNLRKSPPEVSNPIGSPQARLQLN